MRLGVVLATVLTTGGEVAPLLTVQYPPNRTHSPITSPVLDHLRRIAARAPGRREGVFSKVGDSHSVNSHFLSCLAQASPDGFVRPELVQGLAHFQSQSVAGTSSFSRVSLAAGVGWQASSPVRGIQSPLRREIEVAQPRFATVMLGTNDVAVQDLSQFARSLLMVIDSLTEQGVVPVVSTIPPRDDGRSRNAWVNRYNLVVRGLAQARGVPLLDLHRELLPLPNQGLGKDRVHLSVYAPGVAQPCALTGVALEYGSNRRNLLTLEALSRVWAALRTGVAPDEAPDEEASAQLVLGPGAPSEEVVISSLPFVDVRRAAVGEGHHVVYHLNAVRLEAVQLFLIPLSAGLIEVRTPEGALAGKGASGFAALPSGVTALSVGASPAPLGPPFVEFLLAISEDPRGPLAPQKTAAISGP